MADEKTFTKADIDAAVAAAVGKVQASLDALEAKNEELIGEVRTAKQKARAASEIKPEDLTAAEERADRAEAALKEAQKLAKDAAGAKEKAEGALKEEQKFTQKLLVQDGLKSELLKNGINDEAFIDALSAKFASNASVTVEGDVRKAMIGDKSLADAVKEYAASDAGKKFVSAAVNSGGGASGGAAKASTATTMTRAAYSALDQQAKAELMPQMTKGELRIVDEAV